MLDSFVNLTPARVICEEGPELKKMLSTHWPFGQPVVYLLD